MILTNCILKGAVNPALDLEESYLKDLELDRMIESFGSASQKLDRLIESLQTEERTDNQK